MARLAVNSHLPVPLDRIIDVEAGAYAGVPVYLLVAPIKDGWGAFIYRSTDAGKS